MEINVSIIHLGGMYIYIGVSTSRLLSGLFFVA